MMRVRGLSWLPAVCVLATGACSDGGAPSEDIGTETTRIEDGTADTTHTFAVAVIQSSTQMALCSGALLAPNLVATARHCVSQLSSDQIDCSTSTFGNTLPAADLVVTSAANLSTRFTVVPVSQIIVPSGANQTKVCGDDLALLILKSSISLPQYVVPALTPPITDHSYYSEQVTAIGYGITSPTDTTGKSAGVRRIKENIGLVCIPNDPGFTDCFSTPINRQVMTANEFVSGDASTCEGDSGSSAFDQASFDRGQWVSFGVLSRGGTSPNNTTCIQPIYSRFDVWASLVTSAARQAASLGKYAVPSWAADTDGGSAPSVEADAQASIVESVDAASSSGTAGGSTMVVGTSGQRGMSGPSSSGASASIGGSSAGNAAGSSLGSPSGSGSPSGEGGSAAVTTSPSNGDVTRSGTATSSNGGSSNSSGGCSAAGIGASSSLSSVQGFGVLALLGLSLRGRRRLTRGEDSVA